jgi:hypothetical protein
MLQQLDSVYTGRAEHGRNWNSSPHKKNLHYCCPQKLLNIVVPQYQSVPPKQEGSIEAPQ